jgi:tetratricopeptide (TPR) repeat protein
VTDPPATTTPDTAKRRWLLPLVALAMIAAAAVGGFAWRHSHRIVVPEVALQGVEPRVVEEVEKARTEVLEDPKSAEAWGKVGMVLFANDLYAEARPWLERAEQIDAADPRWPYYRGMTLMLDRPEDGIGFLKRAAELVPQDAPIKLRLAEALLTLDRADEAGAAFAEVERLDPENPRALLGRGILLLRRGEPATAVPLLRKAAADPTARKAAHAALSEALTRVGDEKKAEEHRQLAAAAPKDAGWPDPRIIRLQKYQVNLNGLLNRANAAMAAGQGADALALAREVLRDRPDSAQAHLAAGRALAGMRRVDEAEAELRKATECEPGLVQTHFALGGFLLERRRDPAAAEASFRKVLELHPGDVMAHFYLAQCRLQQGDKDGAVEHLKDAVRYRPGFAAAHLALGELYLEAGRTNAALASLEIAARLEPTNEKARDLLARAKKQEK